MGEGPATLRHPFHPAASDLPEVLPLFPLSGVLLMPRGALPLNVFEPRYLAMTRFALAQPQRLIGMIQPKNPPKDPNADDPQPELCAVGCAGRATAFAETQDGRYLITLTGVVRFEIKSELPLQDGFRRARVDYDPFLSDLDLGREPDLDRVRAIKILREVLARQELKLNDDAIRGLSGAALITTLAMAASFSPPENQAVLTCADPDEQAAMILALAEMDLAGGTYGGSDPQ